MDCAHCACESCQAMSHVRQCPAFALILSLPTRLQCASMVDIVVQPHQFWMGAGGSFWHARSVSIWWPSSKSRTLHLFAVFFSLCLRLTMLECGTTWRSTTSYLSSPTGNWYLILSGLAKYLIAMSLRHGPSAGAADLNNRPWPSFDILWPRSLPGINPACGTNFGSTLAPNESFCSWNLDFSAKESGCLQPCFSYTLATNAVVP